MIGTVRYMYESYCNGCPFKDLQITYEQKAEDGSIVSSEPVIKCADRKKCARLYDHLMDAVEGTIDPEPEEDIPEDPDWSWTDDATASDRSL